MSMDISSGITPTEFIEALKSKEFTGFLHSLNNSTSPLLSVSLPIAGIDPLAALELHPDYEEQFYWDHPESDISISAAGRVRELRATGSSRFKEISEATETIKKQIDAFTAIRHSMAGPLFLGGYSFTDHNVGSIWKKFGAARFVLPEWMLIQSGHLHLLTLTFEKKDKSADTIYQEIIERITDFISLAGKLKGSKNSPEKQPLILCTLQSPQDKDLWIKKVNYGKKLIQKGKFEKIVLARSVTLEAKKALKATLLAHELRQKFPECYNFLIQKDKQTAFVGATPERLASFASGTFLTEGLAGSTSRGKSAWEDASLALSLMESQKDRDEHQFVVRAIGDSLKPFSNNVKHPERPQIKKLQNVQHLYTPISASIKNGIKIHELIRELHPTPAVGGYPKEKSVRHIHEIEQIERGWYSAPIGWFNLNGFGEFAVAIRSALIHENRATLYAGCGIVADSDPENEWNETLLKFRPMMEALNHQNV